MTDRPERARVNPPSALGRRPAPLRARAFLLILLLVPPVVFLMVWADWLVGGDGALDSLIGAAVAIITLLATLNLALQRWRPAWAFSPGELIAVYVAIAMSVGLTGSVWCWGGNIAPTIAYPIWMASPANQWDHLLLPNLPPGLTVADRDALEGFMIGHSTPYRLDVLRAWAQPALWWTAWVAAVLWVVLCFSVIVRRRWSQEEKLPFPLTAVPLHLAEPRQRLFGSPLWWLGLGLSSALGLLGVLNLFLPSLPTVTTYLDLTNFLTNNRPWDAIRTTSLSWSPWDIGLSYLMPVDLAFSLLVFNLLWRAEYVGARLGGWLTNAWGGFPYGDQQVIGAYLSLMAVVFWLDRRYLSQVLRRALGLPSAADDSGEAFTYRAAVFGGLAGLLFLWWFLFRAGMSTLIALPFLALLFLMISAMLRMRAHIGPPSHWMYGTMPEFVLTQFPGTRAIGPRGLGLIALLRPFMYEQNSHPAPIQLEALRMADQAAFSPRLLVLVMVAVVPLTMLSYFWASLHVGYDYGLAGKAYQDMVFVCRQTSDKLDDWLRAPGAPNWSGVEAIGLGFTVTAALMYLKLRFPLWPLHPVAFPLAFSWTIDSMIPAVAATWTFKVLLLRYGGLRAHRRALPFFLGLLAGDAALSLLNTLCRCLIGAA